MEAFLFKNNCGIFEYAVGTSIQGTYFARLKRHLVKHAAIFGSVAKQNFNNNSDLDLLIEPAKDFTLFKMLRLEEEISELLKCKVDLVEYSALKPSIKEEVLRSAITIL